MADNQTQANQNSSDEIDLGQLFQMIGKGFNSVFRFILQVFLYLKKNIFILIGLVILGFALGYGLTQIISKKLKTEIIVRPQMESKNYLYDVVDELQSNINSKDTLFFKSIGIENIDFNGLEVTVSRVVEDGATESDIKYLELLQSFENTEAIGDIIRNELQNKSSLNHRITVFYKNSESGQDFANKIIAYINTNPYFDGLIEVYRANASSRIEENQELIKQLDQIITNYANKMGEENTTSESGKIVLDNKETVNITGLFGLKNGLIRDIEAMKLDLERRIDPVNIINFGKTQEVQKSIFRKNIIALPLILISLFFLLSLIRFLNKKSQAL